MPRAYLRLSNRDDIFLQDTKVENLFISEYLPAAPEGYVKVYLFGLMYAQNDMSMDTARLARVLRIKESDVLQAWEYWARMGLVKVEYSRDFTEYNVEYISQIELMYGHKAATNEPESKSADVDVNVKNSEATAEEAIAKVVDMEISAIFRKYEELTGRMISAEDAWKISDAIKTYNILPDIMSYSVDYCISEERGSIRNIVKTAIKWVEEGCRNLEDVKNYIDAHSKRNQYYNMVFHEMGWNRLPSPGDREIMDRWFDELGYSIKEVIEACRAAAGLRDPSLKYVNKVLENKKLEAGGINTREMNKPSKTFGLGSYGDAQESRPQREVPKAMVSRKVLKDYYDYIRSEGEKIQDARIDEVCSKVIALRDLFEFENRLNKEMMGMTLFVDENGRSNKDLLRSQRRELEAEKRRLLRENGYSEDYLARKYRCSVCKDTGITDDGRICSCSEARAKEAYQWNQNR